MDTAPMRPPYTIHQPANEQLRFLVAQTIRRDFLPIPSPYAGDCERLGVVERTFRRYRPFPKYANDALENFVSTLEGSIAQHVGENVEWARRLLAAIATAQSLGVNELWDQFSGLWWDVWIFDTIFSDDDDVASPDYDRWLQKEYWYPDDAVLLSQGLNPDATSRDRLMFWAKIGMKECGDTPFLCDQFLSRSRELANALAAGHLNSPLRSKDFVGWADLEKWEVPEPLIRKGNSATKGHTTAIPAASHKTLYKLLLSIATGLDSKSPNYASTNYPSELTTKIADYTKLQGFEVDFRTIKKSLEAALTWKNVRRAK